MDTPDPNLDELIRTVERMEAKLDASTDIQVRKLMTAYRALKPRFAADLVDERDRALANSATLMLIQHIDQQQHALPQG